MLSYTWQVIQHITSKVNRLDTRFSNEHVAEAYGDENSRMIVISMHLLDNHLWVDFRATCFKLSGSTQYTNGFYFSSHARQQNRN
jgi:hypothetical protein